MDSVEFQFNDIIILLYADNDSERKRLVSLLHYINYIIIINIMEADKSNLYYISKLSYLYKII